MKIIAIIPARYESTRLPHKLLSDINGKSIIQRVYQQAKKSALFDEVVVATDHQKIYDHCISLGIEVEMTSVEHTTGTDRIAEVALRRTADIVINIQGDEPFIEIESLRRLVDLLRNEKVRIGTLYKKIKAPDILFDFNTVKLTKAKNGKVLYFSRQAIPSHRDLAFKEWFEKSDYYQHLGVYGFKSKTLQEVVNLAQSKLEVAEKLEQLRWLEYGYEIFAVEVESESFGIDTEEDLQKARKRYK